MPSFGRKSRAALIVRMAVAAVLMAALPPTVIVISGLISYLRLERSIVEKMDQYYLNLSKPGREEYLLEGDEVFEVPYMASRLSVAAVPTRLLDAQGLLMGEFESEKAVSVRDPEDIPAFLKKALVAAEDATFYEHGGINYKAIARAAWVNLRSLRKKQGGSTLTQQLAKLMFTTRQKTYGRKVFEALCARKLESKFTKDQILLMYLNFVNFGHGSFGVESASRYYFGKPSRRLELAEAALLAGVVANPTRYSPLSRPELARQRQKIVLTRMARLGFIPANSVDRYLLDFWKTMEERLKIPEASFWRMRVNKAPYAVEAVRRALEKEFSKERLLKGGLTIHTTIDLRIQKAAEDALRAGLAAENKAALALSTATPPVEGALAAVRTSDGAILALVGGRGFDFSNQLNRSQDIARPIGSSIKPFIFAAALETGRWKPEDPMLDEPQHFKLPGGKSWSPQNYGNKYFGEVTLREALHRSLNSVAIKLLQSIDIDLALDLLTEAANVPKKDLPRNLSLALGTADLSPVQLAAAYSVLANGGHAVSPGLLRAVEDRDGNPVLTPQSLRHSSADVPLRRVLTKETCTAITAMLQGVLQDPAGTAYGAARRAGLNLPAAGKTGTTSDYRDAWFAGYTPEISASVWIGHDDMRVPLEHGRTGGGLAAPIWMSFIKAAYRDLPTRDFDEMR